MKICPECRINVELPGRDGIKFCPFCGTSLETGEQERKAKISFFTFPLVILILSIFFSNYITNFKSSFALGSDISGKLTLCFLTGAFFYFIICRLFKLKSHFSSYKKAGVMSVIFSIVSFYLSHDINIKYANELGNFISPDIFLAEKRNIFSILILISLILSAIIAVIQNRALINKSENKPYSKICQYLTFISCFLGIVSVYVISFNNSIEDRIIIASEMIFDAGSSEKALNIIEMRTEKLLKGNVKKIPYYKGKFTVVSNFQSTTAEYAVKNLNIALNNFPNSSMVKYYLSSAYLMQGNKKSALKYAEEAYNNATASAALSKYLAKIYIDQDMPEKAIEAYSKSLNINSEDAVSMNNLSNLLLDTDQKIFQALELAKKASDIMPNVYTLDTLAWAYYKNDKISDAIETINHIKSFADEVPEVKFHYLMILNSAGLCKNILEELDKLLIIPEISINKQLVRNIIEAKNKIELIKSKESQFKGNE